MSDSPRNVASRVRPSMLLPGPGSSWEQAAQQQKFFQDAGAATRRRMTLDVGSTCDTRQSQELPALSAPSSSEVGHMSNHSSAAAAALEYEAEKPPPGCAPDAIKLFVGSIPKCCTESQLLPFFETIGKVVDLVIVRDKATRESKGSAFLWYASRAHAELAIMHFNLRHVLPDPSGEHHRPLVLRRAKPRVTPSGPPPPTSSAASSQPTSGQLSSSYSSQPAAGTMQSTGSLPSSRPVRGQFSTSWAPAAQSGPPPNPMPTSRPGSAHSQQGLAFSAADGPGLPARAAVSPIPSPHVSRSLLGSERLSQARSPAMGRHAGPAPTSWPHLAYTYPDAFSAIDDMSGVVAALRNSQLGDGGGGGGVPRSMMPAMPTRGGGAGPSSAPVGQLSSVSLDLTSQQMILVNQYMHGVQDISGAQLSVAVGPTAFHLRVEGLEPQVETAKTLLATIMYSE